MEERVNRDEGKDKDKSLKDIKIREIEPRIKELDSTIRKTGKESDTSSKKERRDIDLDLDDSLDSIAEELERIKRIPDRSLFRLSNENDFRMENEIPFSERGESSQVRGSYASKSDEKKAKYSSDSDE